MSVLITVGLAFIAVILFLWWHIIDRYSYFHRRRIPFIPPKFPAGNFQTVASHEEHIVTWMRNMYLQFRGRDKLFGYYFGTATAIMITDMDTAYDILVRDFNVFPMARGPWNDPLSANLYTMEGEQWRTIRTKLSPVFSTMSTGTVLLSLQTVSEDLVNYVGQFADNPEKPVDVRDLFQRYISDALSQSILGLDTAALRDNNHPLMMIGMEMFQTRGDYDVYFLFLIVSYSHFFRKLPIRVFPSHITDYFIGIMDDAMKARVAGHDAPKNDLLDLLVRIEQAGCLTDDETGEVLGKITHNQLLGHAFMAFIMGFVTTRVTLSYAFYEMAQNPEIQERLRQEIFTALPLDQEITYDTLESIPYLQQVVDGKIIFLCAIHKLINCSSYSRDPSQVCSWIVDREAIECRLPSAQQSTYHRETNENPHPSRRLSQRPARVQEPRPVQSGSHDQGEDEATSSLQFYAIWNR